MAANTQIYRHRLTSTIENPGKWKFNSSQKRLYPVTTGAGVEVLSAVVKNEVNKAGTLEMDVIMNDDDVLIPYRDFISVADVYQEGSSFITRDILFFGRVVTITCDSTLTYHITCEGYLACLSDCPMVSHRKEDMFKLSKGTSLQNQFKTAMLSYLDLMKRQDLTYSCNYFSKKTDAPDAEVSISNETSCGDFIVNTLANTYGGVVYIKYGRNTIPFGNEKATLVWQDGPNENPNIYEDNGIIKWKVNMLDASYENAQDEIFTAVMPWFDDYDSKKHKFTSITQNGRSYPVYYVKSSMAQKYGLIMKSVAFKDCKGSADLAKKAKQWLAQNCVDYGSQYTFKAVDFHYLGTHDTDGVIYDANNGTLKSMTSGNTIKNSVIGQHQSSKSSTIGSPVYAWRIHVLDRVAVTYPAYMKYIDSSSKRSKMICISAEYDIMDPANDTFVIGAVIPPDMTDIKFISKRK